jgi:hypothetical protein
MKCNMQSSTETELISLHDKLSDVIWTRYFVECQGYEIDEYVIFQDNMSTLSLEKNGRISSSKQTKHIKAKILSDQGLLQSRTDRRAILSYRCYVG